MPRKVVVYDDFSAGEYGALSDFDAPKGAFTGTNVMRYIDGSIGPRWEPEAMTVTGLPNGVIRGMGVGLSAANNGSPRLWFIVGTTVYHINPTATSSQAVTTYTTSLASTPTSPVCGVSQGGATSTIGVFQDKLYTLDHNAGSVTAIASSPGAYALCVYGERTLAANNGTNTNRLWYSDANDATAWDTGADGQWLDVGDTSSIVALVNQRGGVAISKVSNSLAQWWRLSGVPGVNETLQQSLVGLATGDHPHAAPLTNGNIAFVGHGKYPAVFTGASVVPLKHLNFPNITGAYTAQDQPPQFRVLQLRDDSDWAVFTDDDHDTDCTAYVLADGAWSKHTFSASADSSWSASLPLSNLVIFAKDGVAGSSTPTFYQWTPKVTRPNFASDSYGTAPSASLCSFTMPEFFAKENEELTVRAVTVDFTKYDHGNSVDNSLTINVTPKSLFGAGDGTAQTSAWSEDEDEATTAGELDRVTANFSFDWGTSFTVGISNIYGVAIRRICVLVDTRPMQGV